MRLRARQDGEEGVRTVESLSIGYVDVAAQSPSSPVRKELWTVAAVGGTGRAGVGVVYL